MSKKGIKTLTPAVLKRMIKEEKEKLVKESNADSFLKQGNNKVNPYTSKSSKGGMQEVQADKYASTINLVNKAKMLKEEERKTRQKLSKILEMKKRIKRQLLRDL